MTIRIAATRNPLIAEPTMTLQFSEDDLLRELGVATVDKGELLWLDDRVRQVEVTAGGARISGNVFGSRPRPYSQTIMLASNGRAITSRAIAAVRSDSIASMSRRCCSSIWNSNSKAWTTRLA
jgi:hypothetical protein